ncbi:MAG TPA: GNAT family N-acetyltransferase [Oceanipulchritudo sp.]|nr:GNAT family N-acetyltransferase [Oceanipulchritudo sp.]
MNFVEIEFGSPLYQQELNLRHEILRRPLGMDLFASDLSGEPGYRHFGLVRDGQLMACVMVVPVEEGLVRFKQMAVRDELQGKGWGRFLISEVERVVRTDGALRVTLNARLSAVEFYHKLGYHGVGEGFTEVTIAHLRMEKDLRSREEREPDQ